MIRFGLNSLATTSLRVACRTVDLQYGCAASQLCARWNSTSSEKNPQEKATDAASTPSVHPEQGTSSTYPNPYSTANHITDSRSNAPLKSAQYKSSMDDATGVQKNWFTSLYKQLNYISKTGAAEGFKGRQKAVFELVEREFEGLYDKYVSNKGLDEATHRATLLTCLSIATYRVLNDELGDTKLVRDIIRTNLGSVMLALLGPVHRFKLWIMRWVLREDMYKQAVSFLPAIRADLGTQCNASVEESSNAVTTMTVNKCMYHDILTREDAPFLLSEFCCHHALLWLHDFRSHGVTVSMDKCMAWDDNCCQLRIARPGQEGLGLSKPGEGQQPQEEQQQPKQ